MLELPITSILTGAAAIMLVTLSLPIALRRRKLRLGAGDGGDQAFNRLIRAQANFIEYTPIALIAIGLAELAGQPQAVVSGLAAGLAAGRLLHAFGLITNVMVARALGAVLTFATLLAAGGLLLAGPIGLI
ncbi:MAG: MAPEG family protein [Caulobacter sp.]|nr:MAPEG family protein [Caulobacter sp.]